MLTASHHPRNRYRNRFRGAQRRMTQSSRSFARLAWARRLGHARPFAPNPAASSSGARSDPVPDLEFPLKPRPTLDSPNGGAHHLGRALSET